MNAPHNTSQAVRVGSRDNIKRDLKSDFKAMKFSGGGRPARVHIFDDGFGRTEPQGIEQTRQLIARSFGNALDRSIRAIADVPNQTQFRGAALGKPSKVDTLHNSGDNGGKSHHKFQISNFRFQIQFQI
jgi:hypothetical protein